MSAVNIGAKKGIVTVNRIINMRLSRKMICNIRSESCIHFLEFFHVADVDIFYAQSPIGDDILEVIDVC